jgi:hypothetical protein
MRLALLAFVATLAWSASANAQVNCYTYGNQMQCSNGQTYQIYGSGGNSAPTQGQSAGGQGPSGNTWTTYGNQIYGPNGRVCTRVGNQLH